MELRIDLDADALYLKLDERATIAETAEVAPGLIVDYGEEGNLVGIELLFLSLRAPGLDTGRLVFEVAPSGASG